MRLFVGSHSLWFPEVLLLLHNHLKTFKVKTNKIITLRHGDTTKGTPSQNTLLLHEGNTPRLYDYEGN